MATEHDSFEQVRKLLALKRHELPPPRYFHEFSGQVMARLQALEAAQPVSWRQRLGLDFDFKPAMMGAFGVVVCGLLLVGVITSLGMPQPSASQFPFPNDPSALFSAATTVPGFAGSFGINPAVKPEEIPSSTVPVGGGPSANSPFRQLLPHAQPAAFSFGAGQ